ncbi:MAG: STAS domain-containing protein [Ruminococcaceae bacterium]|nr:STAS domain-containing protein [Oscillospiraceae bacterium]
MQIKYINTSRSLVVSIDGEIDHHSAADYRKAIDDEFLKTKAVNIIFDFSKLNFMDSSGIGLIMGRYKLISPVKGRVILAGVSPQLDRLISISGIYKIADWAKNINEALAKLQESEVVKNG